MRKIAAEFKWDVWKILDNKSSVKEKIAIDADCSVDCDVGTYESIKYEPIVQKIPERIKKRNCEVLTLSLFGMLWQYVASPSQKLSPNPTITSTIPAKRRFAGLYERMELKLLRV